jgi:hypothetical protein
MAVNSKTNWNYEKLSQIMDCFDKILINTYDYPEPLYLNNCKLIRRNKIALSPINWIQENIKFLG